MSPGGGLRSCAPWLVLATAVCAAAIRDEPTTGNVGCLFSDLVCAADELCFNDEVIGRCVSASSHNHHITSHGRLAPLGGPALGLLEAEMTRVFGLGFSWPDIYTQCVFQTLLHNIYNRQPYSQEQCAQLLTAQRMLPLGEEEEEEGEEEEEEEEEEEVPLNIMEDEEGNIYIPGEALKYLEDPSEMVQEELSQYYRPDQQEQEQEQEHGQEQEQEEQEEEQEELSPKEQARAWADLQQVLEALQSQEAPLRPYSQGDEMIMVSPEEQNYLEEDYPRQQLTYPLQELPYPMQELPYPMQETPYELQEVPYPMQEVPYPLQEENYPLQEDTYPFQELPYPLKYSRPAPDHLQYTAPDHQLEKREVVSSYNLLPQSPNLDYPHQPEDTEYIVPDIYEDPYKTQPPHYQLFDDTEDTQEQDEDEEGDNASEDTDDEIAETDDSRLEQDYNTEDTDKDISNYDFDYADSREPKADDGDDILYYNTDIEPVGVESVFDRRERLDVKKPGPFFSNSPNNFFLDKLAPEDYAARQPNVEDGQTEYEQPLALQARPKKDHSPHTLLTIPEPRHEDTLTIHYNRLTLADQADLLVSFIAQHLGLQPEAFSLARQPESNRLVLTVHANPRSLNASTMADMLNQDSSLKGHADRDLGIDIDRFEAGNKDEVVKLSTSHPSRLLLLLLTATLGLTAILSAVALLIFIRRRTQQKTKDLQEEASEDNKEEPVKEYKQLVRDWSRSSRASQGSVSAPPGPEAASGSPAAGKRVHKISQNSEGSRTSSTSSWQEEPTATAMDISTGHMVLSYMEDHLKNKQRLEQEWVGLCAYEAEPNCTSVAFKVENKKKNRYPDKLPYDHNRVLLNALVNGTNSDYINASTVMDHDPRNPAYIISQGPLAHTVADFWQMVWEQGSVVIVMLSRLSENGYQLAQRYWPEEGSEQYHIFEVHLVSEHVWCEDYLVRSLYLKNCQTGETRTVTQFHFLSWADGATPTSTRAILEFRRKVNKSYRGRSCPMIIHCSDGVGRSGTYVLIDMVLNRMTKGSKEIDIAATLEHIRDQRSGMVQTRSQFEFCLMAVAEETHAILKALPQ